MPNPHEYAIPSLAPGHTVMSRVTGRLGEVLDIPLTVASTGARVLLVAWESGHVSETFPSLVLNLGPSNAL